MPGIPESDVDLFSDGALRDPYPLYAQLREIGPVVWLTAYDMFAFPRYHEVREASGDWRTFSSAKGVMMNDRVNATLEGVTLCSDPPEHTAMRAVLARPMRPAQLREVTPRILREAQRVVDDLISRGTFDAATELAEHLPLTVVSDLVGLGRAGRDRMLDWASATFDAQGPMNERTRAALPKMDEMVRFAMTEAVPGRLNVGGWADRLYAAAAAGELAAEKCPFMMIDYIAPSLDTTIFAISSAIWLFTQHPDQWDRIRAEPSLIPHAINEALRLESPVQRFTRLVTHDVDVHGHVLPAGSRVILLYGSANRDERKYPDADQFDVARKPSDHLAFGRGEHVCVGMNLARIEMRAVMEALVPRVPRFHLIDAELALNNTLRGFKSLTVRTS